MWSVSLQFNFMMLKEEFIAVYYLCEHCPGCECFLSSCAKAAVVLEFVFLSVWIEISIFKLYHISFRVFFSMKGKIQFQFWETSNVFLHCNSNSCNHNNNKYHQWLNFHGNIFNIFTCGRDRLTDENVICIHFTTITWWNAFSYEQKFSWN